PAPALLTVLVDTGPAVPLAVRDQSLIAAGGIGVAALLAGAAAGVRRPAGRAAVLARRPVWRSAWRRSTSRWSWTAGRCRPSARRRWACA
ncbi:hypothetical protein, partial [Streptomyces phaeoluteigriseus]|uniref:hypothetical protein n=1 Tax=Streptomyces phaeoluteigriseus TaxID=114686 RepID=UPI0013019F37